jgi:murein DD-endopeptidase MepM/ murein hydrolase activator NlpD
MSVLGLMVSACSGPSGAPSAAVTPSPADTALTMPTVPPVVTAAPLVTPSLSNAPVKYTFPVKGSSSFSRYRPGFPAIDVYAPCGTDVVAPAGAQIKSLVRKDAWSSANDTAQTRPGVQVTLIGPGNVRYVFTHLETVPYSVQAGRFVSTGTVIATTGNSGNAGADPCGARISISPSCGPLAWWLKPGGVSPYPYLESWKDGGNSSPVEAVAGWKGSDGCDKSAH